MPLPEAGSNRLTEPDDRVVFQGENKKVVPGLKQQEVPEGSPIKGPPQQPPFRAQKRIVLYFSPDVHEQHSKRFEVLKDKAQNLGKNPEINALGWAAELVEPCTSANYFDANPYWVLKEWSKPATVWVFLLFRTKDNELEPKLNPNGEDTTFCELREAIQRLEGWQYRDHGLDHCFFEHAWAEQERLRTGQEEPSWGAPGLL